VEKKARAITIRTREARELVYPESIEDVLLSLQKDGFIRAFHIGERKIHIWESPERSLDAFLFSWETGLPIKKTSRMKR
jgi:hypothetical protein